MVSPMLYVECDVPPGLTLAEWRHRKARESDRKSRFARLCSTIRHSRP